MPEKANPMAAKVIPYLAMMPPAAALLCCRVSLAALVELALRPVYYLYVSMQEKACPAALVVWIPSLLSERQ